MSIPFTAIIGFVFLIVGLVSEDSHVIATALILSSIWLAACLIMLEINEEKTKAK